VSKPLDFLERPFGCTCGAVAQLQAALDGREHEPCPVHEQSELKARETARKRADAEAEYQAKTDAIDRVRADDVLKREARERAAREQAEAAARVELAEASPFVARLADAVGADPVVALEQHRARQPGPERQWPGLNSHELEDNVRAAFTDDPDLPPAA